jgi:hypothetical protein
MGGQIEESLTPHHHPDVLVIVDSPTINEHPRGLREAITIMKFTPQGIPHSSRAPRILTMGAKKPL